ncbi:MAG TPA: hypothetical protein VE985_10120 [Gaiellaceae bacterium]|nr:hypothetical protein [Gaiellaceae bacterium]
MLLAALAVLIAATAIVFAVTRSGGGQGPLVPLISGKEGYGVVLHLHQSASISGPLIIRNGSDHALVLDRVEPVGLQDGLEFLGAYVLTHPNAIGEVHGYRVPANGHPLPGATMAPHSQVELVFGVKAAKLGRHAFTSLDVLYHGGGTYRRHVALGVAVCAPYSLKTCATPLNGSGG